MGIDKKILYVSDRHIYHIVARPYTNDYIVEEKMYTKDEVIAMFKELKTEIEEKVIRKQGIDSGFEYDYEFIQSEEVVEIIQQKINALKGDRRCD